MSDTKISSIDSKHEHEDLEETEDDVKEVRLSTCSEPKSEDRRVYFQEDVAVRYLSPSVSVDLSEEILSDNLSFNIYDTTETLSTEDKQTYRTSDISSIDSSSLDIVCEDIMSETRENPENVIPNLASTSKVSTRLLQEPENFEECFAEMEVYMRETYPKYYAFLHSHIINAADGTEEQGQQEAEFKDAIVSCRQYPPEYFEDLENTLKIYSRINTKNNLPNS